MRTVAKLPSIDRQELFAGTAKKAGLTDAMVEKDFWVCWTLDYLFHRCRWKDRLAFKGGTSLSKAYNLIQRFSEDIDLILDWRVLGYGANEPWEPRSKSKQDRLNKEANEKTVNFLRDEVVPAIRADVFSELGAGVQIEPDTEDGQTILFTYPHLFTEPATSILTVLPERTFWEKATILHHEANRPAGNTMPPRYSRHYYDMYRLSASWVKDAAFADLGLLKRVVEFKSKFYPRSWAGYEYAVPGTMKLMPPLHCMKSLEADYRLMGDMIFGMKPRFNGMMESIRALENEINSLA